MGLFDIVNNATNVYRNLGNAVSNVFSNTPVSGWANNFSNTVSNAANYAAEQARQAEQQRQAEAARKAAEEAARQAAINNSIFKGGAFENRGNTINGKSQAAIANTFANIDRFGDALGGLFSAALNGGSENLVDKAQRKVNQKSAMAKAWGEPYTDVAKSIQNNNNASRIAGNITTAVDNIIKNSPQAKDKNWQDINPMEAAEIYGAEGAPFARYSNALQAPEKDQVVTSMDPLDWVGSLITGKPIRKDTLQGQYNTMADYSLQAITAPFLEAKLGQAIDKGLTGVKEIADLSPKAMRALGGESAVMREMSNNGIKNFDEAIKAIEKSSASKETKAAQKAAIGRDKGFNLNPKTRVKAVAEETKPLEAQSTRNIIDNPAIGPSAEQQALDAFGVNSVEDLRNLEAAVRFATMPTTKAIEPTQKAVANAVKQAQNNPGFGQVMKNLVTKADDVYEDMPVTRAILDYATGVNKFAPNMVPETIEKMSPEAYKLASGFGNTMIGTADILGKSQRNNANQNNNEFFKSWDGKEIPYYDIYDKDDNYIMTALGTQDKGVEWETAANSSLDSWDGNTYLNLNGEITYGSGYVPNTPYNQRMMEAWRSNSLRSWEQGLMDTGQSYGDGSMSTGRRQAMTNQYVLPSLKETLEYDMGNTGTTTGYNSIDPYLTYDYHKNAGFQNERDVLNKLVEYMNRADYRDSLEGKDAQQRRADVIGAALSEDSKTYNDLAKALNEAIKSDFYDENENFLIDTRAAAQNLDQADRFYNYIIDTQGGQEYADEAGKPIWGNRENGGYTLWRMDAYDPTVNNEKFGSMGDMIDRLWLDMYKQELRDAGYSEDDIKRMTQLDDTGRLTAQSITDANEYWSRPENVLSIDDYGNLINYLRIGNDYNSILDLVRAMGEGWAPTTMSNEMAELLFQNKDKATRDKALAQYLTNAVFQYESDNLDALKQMYPGFSLEKNPFIDLEDINNALANVGDPLVIGRRYNSNGDESVFNHYGDRTNARGEGYTIGDVEVPRNYIPYNTTGIGQNPTPGYKLDQNDVDKLLKMLNNAEPEQYGYTYRDTEGYQNYENALRNASFDIDQALKGTQVPAYEPEYYADPYMIF